VESLKGEYDSKLKEIAAHHKRAVGSKEQTWKEEKQKLLEELDRTKWQIQQNEKMHEKLMQELNKRFENFYPSKDGEASEEEHY
jgi:adenylate cyclase